MNLSKSVKIRTFWIPTHPQIQPCHRNQASSDTAKLITYVPIFSNMDVICSAPGAETFRYFSVITAQTELDAVAGLKVCTGVSVKTFWWDLKEYRGTTWYVLCIYFLLFIIPVVFCRNCKSNVIIKNNSFMWYVSMTIINRIWCLYRSTLVKSYKIVSVNWPLQFGITPTYEGNHTYRDLKNNWAMQSKIFFKICEGISCSSFYAKEFDANDH